MAAARELGALLAQRGLGLVYGGAGVGLMGELANAVLAAGGEVIGVMPQALWDREIGHTGLTEMRVVVSMHERKSTMADLADAFIALPGGIGTLEEFFEIWTWGQLGIHRKPFGLLDVAGYYSLLATFLDHAVAQGFLRRPHRALVKMEASPTALLDRLLTTRPPATDVLIDPRER